MVQTITISAVFAILWLHNKKRYFHLHFAIGFFFSSLSAGSGIFLEKHQALFSLFSIIALTFWIAATFHAQSRKFEVFIAAPLAIFCAAVLLDPVPDGGMLLFFGFHTANMIGFSLLAYMLVTNKRHHSATRKFLAFFLVGYSATLALLNGSTLFVQAYAVHLYPFSSFAENMLTLFGLTIILMITAKMVIEDTECRLTHLALTDHLTGIYNRRALDQVFREGQLQASDSLQFIAITMFDIDHFKKINDQYGHAFGDYVLKCFVKLVEKRIGPNDDFIRMGGEEFAVISKISALFEASQLAERIRIDFGNLTLKQEDKSHRATVSAGIAAQPVYRADLYALLSMADRGLYSAKKSGRDRCVIHDEATNVVIPSEQRDPVEELEAATDKQVAVLNRISAIAEVHKAAP